MRIRLSDWRARRSGVACSQDALASLDVIQLVVEGRQRLLGRHWHCRKLAVERSCYARKVRRDVLEAVVLLHLEGLVLLPVFVRLREEGFENVVELGMVVDICMESVMVICKDARTRGCEETIGPRPPPNPCPAAGRARMSASVKRRVVIRAARSGTGRSEDECGKEQGFY